MTELKEPHFEVIDRNKYRLHEIKQQAIKTIQELLTNHTKKELIEIINENNKEEV